MWQLVGSSYRTGATSAGASSTTTTTPTPTPTRGSAASTLRTRTLAIGGVALLSSRLWLASKLNGDLTLNDLLAGKLSDGALSLTGG